MKCLLIAIVWLASLPYSSALVHYKVMEKGKNGCKVDDSTEVAAGEFTQDNNTCGVVACQNKEGEAFIHYCQIPVTFAECPETAVVTTIDFPQCCWTCATWGKCADNSTSSGTGSDTGADGTGAGGTGAGRTGADGTGADGTGAGRTGAGGTGAGGTGADGTGAGATAQASRTNPNLLKTHKIFTSKFKNPEELSGLKELENIKINEGTPIIKYGQARKNSNPSKEVGPKPSILLIGP